MPELNWVDYSILAIIAVSVVISLLRGFTKEALSLAGWVLAFYVGLTFADKLAVRLEAHIEVPSIRMIVAFAILAIATLFLAGLLSYLAVQLIKKTGLSGTDRMIGVFFGVARGCVVIAGLVLIGGMTALPQDPWWGQSHFIPYFQDMAIWIKQYLPPDLAETVKFI